MDTQTRRKIDKYLQKMQRRPKEEKRDAKVVGEEGWKHKQNTTQTEKTGCSIECHSTKLKVTLLLLLLATNLYHSAASAYDKHKI